MTNEDTNQAPEDDNAGSDSTPPEPNPPDLEARVLYETFAEDLENGTILQPDFEIKSDESDD